MKRIFSFFLACVFFTITLGSCSGNENTQSEIKSELSSYKRSTVSFPNGETVSDILPYYSASNGELTVISQLQKEVFDIDPETEEAVFVRYDYSYYSVTLDSDMNIVSHTPIDTDGSAIGSAYLNSDSLYVLSGSDVLSLSKYSLSDGKQESVTRLDSTVPDIICSLAVDGDGFTYLADSDGLKIFSSDGNSVSDIALPYYDTVLSLSPDGYVYIGAEFEKGYGVAQLGLAKKAYGNITYYDDKIEGIFFCGVTMYVSTARGLFRSDEQELTQIMDFSADGKSSSDSAIIAVAGDDRFFELLYNYSGSIPGYILTVSDRYDGNEEENEYVDVAVLTKYEADILGKNVSSFNSSHSGSATVRIVDYSPYDDGSIMNGSAATRLVMDMVSGAYQPDVIVTSPRLTELNEYIVKNRLFTDYNTLFERDDSLIKSDDIFECVKSAFSDDSGKMWAMTDRFTVSTQLISKVYLGSHTTWTIDDMIDISETMPNGTILSMSSIRRLYENNYVSMYPYYSQFIDVENHSCDFYSETFIRFLNYIYRLPENYPIFEEKYYMNERGERYENPIGSLLTADGLAAVNDQDLLSIRHWKIFDFDFSDEYEIVGYPHKKGSGNYFNYIRGYIITSYSNSVDGSWEFVNYLLIREAVGSNSKTEISGIPTYGILFDKVFEKVIEVQNSFSSDTDNSKYYKTNAIITYDDYNDIVDFLNLNVGGTIYEYVPEKVAEIVVEEVSKYLNDATTAEQCSKSIQSRVSIWLSENE